VNNSMQQKHNANSSLITILININNDKSKELKNVFDFHNSNSETVG
jgi:hypothetical protein